jgi:hypothetical protein
MYRMAAFSAPRQVLLHSWSSAGGTTVAADLTDVSEVARKLRGEAYVEMGFSVDARMAKT